MAVISEVQANPLIQDYVNLLEKTLLGEVSPDFSRFSRRQWWQRAIASLLKLKGLELVKETNPLDRKEGLDWPVVAMTMIGRKRMENIRICVEDVIKNNIPGDFIETGVWRGGACIFLRGLCKAYGITDKTVWVADSFEGLPPSTTEIDKKLAPNYHESNDVIGVSFEDVSENFKRFDLLDNQVKFLKGWFKDTLPTAPIESLSILRLDGDLYESTMDTLVSLYPKLSSGGYIIIDDHFGWDTCRLAVEEYRKKNNIEEEIIKVDWTGAYWKKK